MMDYRSFLRFCREIIPADARQGEHYLEEHSSRLFQTYRVCSSLLPLGSSLISVGAGSAYVEHALSKIHGIHVTVVDFPEAIQAHRSEYDRSNFKAYGFDLTRPEDIPERYDLALSCEIIEHIPAAPQKHLSLLKSWLKENGHIVVTTPNLAHLGNIVALLRMAPIMPPAEQFFSPVGFENEGVHRREYVPREIIQAFTALSFDHKETIFTNNHPPQSKKDYVKSIAGLLRARFRQTMILVAQRNHEQ